ncbi:GvpL/GvpF family gas vesicle protein [Streptomyces chartreusis]|uniref:GvpL/GvpF family gas vesicle protein n=1 Tax=Streptomyces chartreusis TaxID=1969 RepID=UPI0036487B07
MSIYVYGIAEAGNPSLPEQADGIGDPPRPVRILREGDLAAIVSDAPEDLRPKRRDLLAHQHVLAQAGSSGLVLPMRFGSLAQDDAAVTAVLAERAAHYVQRLRDLAGTAEYNVKASHHEEAALHLVLAQNEAIHALVKETRQAGGGSQQEKLELGEMVATAMQAQERRDAALLQQELQPAAEAVSVGQQSTGWLANLSFLVDSDHIDPFLAAVDQVRGDHPHLNIQVNGPLPPYSFVEPPPQPPDLSDTSHATGQTPTSAR